MAESQWITRFRLALRSPDGLRRGRDFIAAQALRRIPENTRRRLFAGDRHYCPVCESRLRTFIRLHRAYNLFCPVCWSLQRHRFIWIFFREWLLPRMNLDHEWRMLHLAPEPSLAERFAALPGVRYLSADIADPGAMVRMDITDIHYENGAFDLIYCSHVLEHVSDDHRALREFHRVLHDNGRAVIVVPIKRAQTYEDASITDAQSREVAFGQHDHVREYGWDVVQRMEAAGFRVTALRRADLVEEAEVARLGLTSDETVFMLDKNRTIR